MESGPGRLFILQIERKNSGRPSWSGSGSVVVIFWLFWANDNNNKRNFRFLVGDVVPEVVGLSAHRGCDLFRRLVGLPDFRASWRAAGGPELASEVHQM